RLLWHNFEWIASSPESLGTDRPVLRGGLVRIPIRLDDHPVYRGEIGFEAWKETLLETIESHEVTAFSLHDCYAHLWLDRYPELLEEVAALGAFRTLDELASEVTLAAGI